MFQLTVELYCKNLEDSIRCVFKYHIKFVKKRFVHEKTSLCRSAARRYHSTSLHQGYGCVYFFVSRRCLHQSGNFWGCLNFHLCYTIYILLFYQILNAENLLLDFLNMRLSALFLLSFPSMTRTRDVFFSRPKACNCS
jgi:hypothetical protein